MKDRLQKLKAFGRREQGFTLAELLVGLLIFGVLASIAIPMFINQRESAKTSELRADLANAAINLENSKPDNGGRYPDNLPDDIVLTTDGAELKYTYPYNRMDYCLQIIAGDDTFFKSNNDLQPTTTDCTYEYVVPATKLSGQMSGYKPVLTWRTVASATSYVIYKNNIPVQTVNVPSSAATTSTSYTLPAMAPEEFATFYIVVQDGATSSPQSNSVSLTAPIPPPVAPTLKIAASEPKSSTTQQYTLQWATVKYADSYELWDVTASPVLINGSIGAATTSYQIDKQRGTTTKVILRAKNTEGISPDSNELSLTTSWPAGAIISGSSNVTDATMNFVFQNVANNVRTPDWGTGTPNSQVRLKVVESGTGTLVFDQSGITTPTFTPPKTFNRVNHTATIIVTTATGQVLAESAPITVTFPKPVAPAGVTGFIGTTGGTASISPNRLTWNAVTCINASTPEYFISHDVAQNNTRNSGWIPATSWNIPQAYLAEGNPESFDIVARCVNANGTSSNGPSVTTSFTTGILPPTTPTGLTAANRGSTVSWNAAVCAVGTTAEYSLVQSIKNDTNVANTFTTRNLNYPLADLTPGTKQQVTIAARCAQFNPDGSVKANSSWSAASVAYPWTTPMPQPAAPTLTLSGKTVASATDVNYQISWNTVSWAQTYQVYNADSPTTPIATTGISTTTTNIKVTRGTTMNVFVKAVNSDASSAASNTVALADTWPTPVILATETYPYDGKIYIKWQNGTDTAPTPDWGTPGYKVKVNVYNARTGVTKTYTDIAAREFTTTDGFTREDHTVRVYVTTSTGVELPSNAVTVSFPPPGPPAPVTGLRTSNLGPGAIKENRLVWDPVACGTSTPEYLITNTDGSGNSGWIAGTVSGTVRYYDLPQGWLKQGFNEAFTIAARCNNPNGASTASADASINFNATILTPSAVTGVTNNGIDIINWAHSTAPTGLSREYIITYVTKNGVASTETLRTTNSTITLTGLSPDTMQKVWVGVRFFNPANGISSATSPIAAGNTTEWRTPKPVPVAPVIKLDSSVKTSTTHQRYTISWPAVAWTETYRIVNTVDGAILKDGIAGSAVSTFIDLKRGAPATSIALQAYNTSGSSNNSNALSLSAPWATPVVNTVTTERSGSANFAWQTGTFPDYTPDWGTPGYTVDLEIKKDNSATGAVVYTATGLTTPSHDSTVFAATAALRTNINYYAQIKVTTVNGEVLTSAWKNFRFEVPVTPARALNVRSDAGGSGPIKNDRLLWDAVTCANGATPQYWAGTVAPGTVNPWTHMVGWTPSITSHVIPQTRLQPLQGQQIAFVVMTRCVFPEGDASGYQWATLNGDGYHEFTVGIAPPTTNPGTPTRVDETNNTISWSAAVCATGFTPEYTLNKPTHNGVASTTTKYTTAATSYALPGITAGSNQSVQVAAKCVSDTDATKFSSDGAYSGVYSYRAPLAKPAAPVITKGVTSATSPTASNVNISWGAVAGAEYYDVFNADTGAKITTVASPGTSAGISVVRGSNGTVNVNVKAGNFTFPSSINAASNTLALNAPWPAAAIISANSNDQKQIVVKWQNSDTSPDWGNPNDSVVVYAEQPDGTLIYTSPVQTGQSLTFGVTNAVTTSVYIKVTTANGEVLTSPKSTVNFIMPAAPARVANLKITDGPAAVGPDVLTWDAVTCTVAGTTAQYYVRQYTEGSTTTAKYNSDWTITANTFTVPQAQINQGAIYTYGVFARCVNGNGQSGHAGDAQITAPITNVVTPAAPANFRMTANNDNGTATFTWDTISCPAYLTTGYMVYFSQQNDIVVNVAAVNPGSDNVATISGLDNGKSHTAYVKARCYDADATSYWANAQPSNSVDWTTPWPVATTPNNLRMDSRSNTPTIATFTVSWDASQNADSYEVLNASTLAVLKTVAHPAVTTTVDITRGTTMDIVVRAKNTRNISPVSNTVNLDATWDTPVIKEARANADGTIYLRWQDGTGTAATPDWGNPGYKVKATVTRDQTAYYNAIQIGTNWQQFRDVLATRDITGDGKADVIAMNPSLNSGRLMGYNGNGGSGTAGNSGFYTGETRGNGWNMFDKIFTPGDLDGDQRADVYGRTPEGVLYMYKGNAYGILSPGVIKGTGGWQNMKDLLHAGDLTADGKADMLVTSNTGDLRLYVGDGTGGFTSSSVKETGFQVYNHVIAAGDQNTDGKPDLIGVKADGTMWIHTGEGSGNFANARQIDVGFGVYDRIVGGFDYSGDLKPDLLMTKADGTLWLIRGGSLGRQQPNGNYVYASADIAGPSVTTGTMPNRGSYSASITVTTATGDVLTSAPVNVTFAAPTAAPAVPTGLVSDPWGGSDVAKNNRVLWNAVSCPSGSWPEYFIKKDRENNVLGNWGESKWMGGAASYNYPDSMLEQGSTMSAVLWARCTNETGIGPQSDLTYTIWTTGVDAPEAQDSWGDGWTTLHWDAKTCAPNTYIQNRAVQTRQNGNDGAWYHAWQTPGTSYAMPGNQGHPIGGYVQRKCVGPNAESGIVSATNDYWTTGIGAPWQGWGPGAGGGFGYRTAQWSAGCPTGTSVQYVFAIRDLNGADIYRGGYWWRNYNWSGQTSFSEQNQAWGSGFVDISARCTTPWAIGPEAGWRGQF